MADSPETLRKKFENQARKAAEPKPVAPAQTDDSVVPKESRDAKDYGKKNDDSLKKNPLTKVFEKFFGSNRLDKDLRDVINLEQKEGGAPLEALHYQLAETWTKEAIYKHKDPQEVVDAISRIAVIYADNPTEFVRYKQLITQVVQLAPDTNAQLKDMVAASQKQLGVLAVTEPDIAAQVNQVNQALEDVHQGVAHYYDQIERPRPNDPKDQELHDLIINPREFKSSAARVAAANINADVQGDRLLYSDKRKIDDLRKREIDNQLGIPIGEREKLNNILTFKANDAETKIMGVRNDLKEYFRLVTEKQRIAGNLIRGVNERIETNRQMNPVNPQLQMFMSHLSIPDEAVMSTGTLFSELESLKKVPEAMAQLGNNTSDIETVLRIRKEQSELTKVMKESSGGPDLQRVGVTDKKAIEAFGWVNNPDKFIEKDFAEIIERKKQIAQLNGKPINEEEARTEAFLEVKEKIKILTQELLGVADAADDVFFEHLFSQLFHDPIFNNIVTGRDKIQSKFLAEERNKPDNEKIKVNVKTFNYETKLYESKPINLTEALSRLQDEVKFDREWKKYTHNIYVLMLQRSPLETYKNYSNSVSTAAVDMLMVDNPDLERAIRLHMSFLRTKYGLSGWKTPVESIYTPDSKSRVIPIDDYVRKELRKVVDPSVSETRIKELTTMARGYVLGISWEGVDAMASGSPVGGTPGRFTGYFGPLDKFNYNNFVIRRWGSRYPNFDYMFTRIKGKGSTEPWDVRKELIRSKQYQSEIELKEPSRVVTDKMVEEGIPFVTDTYYMGIGGIETRWGWRKQMYNHLLFEGEGANRRKLNSDLSADRKKIIKSFMSVNLSVANRQIEDWAGENSHPKDWSKGERNELRKIVLEHMRDIAPQEFFTLENDLLHHSNVKKHWANSKEADELMLGAARVTDHLLENTRGEAVQTLKSMTEAEWNFLFKGDDVAMGGKVRAFMVDAQKTADAAINGTTLSFSETRTSVEHGKEVKKTHPKTVHITPWKEAAYFKSFPTHLSVKRNGYWGILKENVVGRLATDNDGITTAYANYWTKIVPLMKEYQASPNMARQEKFNKFLTEVSAVWGAYQGVHGDSADQLERASSYRISYQLITLFDKYYAKSWYARLPVGAGSVVGQMTPYSSWAHLTTGVPSVLQMDEQNHRVLADEAIKRQLVAPAHGMVVDKADPVKIPGTNITIWHKIKLNKMLWNGAQLRAEMGATNLQVSADIARSYVPLILLLIAMSAAGKAIEEDNK